MLRSVSAYAGKIAAAPARGAMPPAKKAKTVAAGQPLIAAAFARRASGDGAAGVAGGSNPQASPPGGGAAPPSFSAAALVRCREAVLEYTDYTVNNIRNDAGTRASERADEADTAENGARGRCCPFWRVGLRVLHACLRAPARAAAVITRAPAAASARGAIHSGRERAPRRRTHKRRETRTLTHARFLRSVPTAAAAAKTEARFAEALHDMMHAHPDQVPPQCAPSRAHENTHTKTR
jgi:hypothetical protein